ncbi:unnamed protein product [Clonostachys rosea]|uniref:Protein kinase domain-containing protein n=1 Tax=Bionectria ochroleuca TaxID=29856 RepID=A0ABY6U9Y6_BIOOC|nr:unnamed protein product [Clonostachys rosea]
MDFATGLPEIVQDSRLDVRFASEGQRRYTIHPQAATRRSRYIEERWIHERVLGQGGQGSVDLQVKDLGRPGTLQQRAVKKIRLQNGEAQQSKMIQRELEAIFKFSQARYSELFVQSYGWFLSDGLIHIAMEYHELGDLQHFLDDSARCPGKRLPEHDAHDISLQVLDALCLMHEQGFSHRDLKPANILIKHQPPNPWWIKLGDFGISKRCGEMSQLTTIGGTPSFMPPELRFHSTRISTRPFAADMWSYGETIYRMLTGQPMFDGDTLLDYWQGRAAFPEEALRRLKTSNNAIEFIKKLVVPESDKRISSEQALHDPWIDVPAPQSHQQPRPNQQEQTLPFRPQPVSDEYSKTWPDNSSTGAQTAKFSSTAASTYSNVWPDEPSTTTTQLRQTTYSSLWADSPSTNPTSYGGSTRMPHQTSSTSIDSSSHSRSASQASTGSIPAHPTSDPSVLGPHHHTLEKCRKLSGKAKAAFKDENYQQAETIYRDVWKIKTRTLGSDHPETTESKMKLAEAMAEQGNNQKLIVAESMHREVWQLRKNTLGSEHRDTLLAEQGLASALSCLDRDDEAEGMFRGVLSAQKKTLGDEHGDTLRTMTGLADLLLHGEENNEETVKEAVDILERVLEIKLEILGAEDDDTALTMRLLSSAYFKQQFFAEAELLSERALQIIQSKYGKDHKKAFGIMHGLAGTLHMQGKAEECEKLMRELVETKTRVLGESEAADMIYELAEHLGTTGKIDEAEQYYRKALRIQKDEEKANHINVPIMEALARLLFGKVEEQEAISLSREAVDIRKKTDGIEHAATLHSMHILGKMMLEASETEGESLAIFEEVISLRQRVLGFEHEDTLQATVDLAHAYSKMGENEKAETTYKKVIWVQRRELGAKHPHTLDTMSRLASFLIKADRMPEAERMLEDVIAGRKEALGESHPDTIESMESLRDVFSEQEKLNDATRVAEKIVELQKDSLGEEHDETMGAMLVLGHMHTRQDEFLKAKLLYQKIIKTMTSNSDRDDEILRLAVLQLVELLHLQGKIEEAEWACQDALQRIAKNKDNTGTDIVQFKESLGQELYEAEIYKIAAKLQREVVKAKSDSVGVENEATLRAMKKLAKSLMGLGDYQRALEFFQEVVDSQETVLGKDHDDTLDTMAGLAEALSKLSRYREQHKVLNELFFRQRARFGSDDERTRHTLNQIKIYEESEAPISNRAETQGGEHVETIEDL